MKPELKKILDRIFMGQIPKSVSFLDDEAVGEAMKKQGVISNPESKFPDGVINMNYVTFIQDVAEIQLNKTQGKQRTTEPGELQRNLGIIIRSSYIQFIHDSTKGNDEKLYLTFFIRKILVTYELIYRTYMVDDQEAFTSGLLDLQNYYYGICIQQQEQAQQHRPKPKPFELSPEWHYSQELLLELSKELFDNGFTDSQFALIAAFDKNHIGKSNWIKERTTLKYLLWLLLDKGVTEKPSEIVIEMCCKKFTVKGESTSRKIAMSTNIQKQIDCGRNNLKGGFLALQNSYQDLGFQ